MALIAVLMILGGLFAAVHCARASVREFKAGVALGGPQFGDHERTNSPVGFWLIIAGNLAAAVLGLCLMLVGVGLVLIDRGIVP